MVHVCDVSGCGQSFARRYRLANHRRSVHGIGGQKIRCDHCRNEFSSRDHLRRHFGHCMVLRAEAHCAAVLQEVVEQPPPPVMDPLLLPVVDQLLPPVVEQPLEVVVHAGMPDLEAAPVALVQPDQELDQFLDHIEEYDLVRRPTGIFTGQVYGCPFCPSLFEDRAEFVAHQHVIRWVDGVPVISDQPI